MLALISIIGLFDFNLFLNRSLAKGEFGEKLVASLLNKMDSEKYTLLNNLYIPKGDGTTIQIDHIVISYKGIFVIETKNFSGWIFGDDSNRYWTQVIYKKKSKFYNPVWQNAAHIKALKEFLGETLKDIPVFSVIVFGPQATLKIKTPLKGAIAFSIHNLFAYFRSMPENYSVSYLDRIKVKQQLQPLYIQDKKQQKEQRNQHVSHIKQEVSRKENLVSINKCPQCGGELLERQGKYGKFKGCSHYPKCKFTSKT